MRLKFMATIERLATRENQTSSHRGTCLDAESPAALDAKPTRAVTAKWNPVRVVAACRDHAFIMHQYKHTNLAN